MIVSYSLCVVIKEKINGFQIQIYTFYQDITTVKLFRNCIKFYKYIFMMQFTGLN